MSTATLPDETLIDVPSEYLEAWLNGEIEETCGFRPVILVCGYPASFLMYYKAACPCPGHRGSLFMCATCHDLVLDLGATCMSCGTFIEVKFFERIK